MCACRLPPCCSVRASGNRSAASTLRSGHRHRRGSRFSHRILCVIHPLVHYHLLTPPLSSPSTICDRPETSSQSVYEFVYCQKFPKSSMFDSHSDLLFWSKFNPLIHFYFPHFSDLQSYFESSQARPNQQQQQQQQLPFLVSDCQTLQTYNPNQSNRHRSLDTNT